MHFLPDRSSPEGLRRGTNTSKNRAELDRSGNGKRPPRPIPAGALKPQPALYRTLRTFTGTGLRTMSITGEVR